MTPEERAVIDAAVRWSRTETIGESEDAGEALQDAIESYQRSTAPAPEPEWVVSTWGEAAYGDHVRLPGRPETEAVVESVRRVPWHTKLVWSKRIEDYPNGTQQWRDRVEPHEHEKVHVRMHGRTDMLAFDPAQAIEILMDDERRAAHLLQLTFHAERVDYSI